MRHLLRARCDRGTQTEKPPRNHFSAGLSLLLALLVASLLLGTKILKSKVEVREQQMREMSQHSAHLVAQVLVQNDKELGRERDRVLALSRENEALGIQNSQLAAELAEIAGVLSN